MVLLRVYPVSLLCPSGTKKRGRRREQSGAYEATLALAVKKRKELNKKNSTDACGQPENRERQLASAEADVQNKD